MAKVHSISRTLMKQFEISERPMNFVVTSLKLTMNKKEKKYSTSQKNSYEITSESRNRNQFSNLKLNKNFLKSMRIFKKSLPVYRGYNRRQVKDIEPLNTKSEKEFCIRNKAGSALGTTLTPLTNYNMNKTGNRSTNRTRISPTRKDHNAESAPSQNTLAKISLPHAKISNEFAKLAASTTAVANKIKTLRFINFRNRFNIKKLKAISIKSPNSQNVDNIKRPRYWDYKDINSPQVATRSVSKQRNAREDSSEIKNIILPTPSKLRPLQKPHKKVQINLLLNQLPRFQPKEENQMNINSLIRVFPTSNPRIADAKAEVPQSKGERVSIGTSTERNSSDDNVNNKISSWKMNEVNEIYLDYDSESDKE